MIELIHASRRYASGTEPVHALRDVDLRVTRGEFIAILGPSGSGKSTLLHILGCLDALTAGDYRFQGRSVLGLSVNELAAIRNRSIGFVFQNFHLLPRATALQNVQLPLVFAGVRRAARRATATALLRQMGLTNRRDHLPGTLSGGERQRVAIARALANAPDLLLADEPTGNLDSQTGDQIIALLRTLVDERQQTVVMVTHDATHAAIADRVITMYDGRFDSDRRLPRGHAAGEVLDDPAQSICARGA
jgi:putative ABC transport system ATP-binding protein